MPIQFGNNNIKLDGISEVYVGSNKVYSATPPGPPIIDNPVNEYFCVYSAKNFTIRFEMIRTANVSASLNYNNLKLKYSTDKTTWTEVSAAQGFNFNGGTLYYIYTSSADVGTFVSDIDAGRSSASWGQVFSAPYYGYYSYASTRMKFSGTSTIYLMGNIRTIAQGDQATPYNGYVGSKTKINYVGMTVYSSSYSMYYTRACGLGSSTYQSTGSSEYSPHYLRARGIFNIQGTSNSIIDINNLFIGDYEESGPSYPSFTYATGTPYTPPYDPINDYFWIENRKSSSDTIQFTFITNLTSSKFSPTLSSSSDFFYYSTDKTTWTPHTASNLTIPANTRYYFYSNRSEGPSPQSGSVSSGKAYPYFNSFGGLNAAAKINGSFQPSLYANLGFGGNASSNLAIGGNIRTLLGKGKGGVGDTSLLERGSKYSMMIDSYNQCRYIGYTALGTASTSFSNSQKDIGLFFTGITDAGNLYIGNSDHEAEFSLITPTTLPIYT